MDATATQGLTEDQRKALLELIGDFTKEELGPLVKDIVEESLKASSSQPNVIELLKGMQVQPPTETDKGELFGRVIRALANGKGDPDRATAFAKKAWGDDDPVIKALAAGEATAGGFIVPPNYSDEIIELLRPATAVRALGAQTLPMDNGSLQVPKLTAGATGNYIGENQDITISQQQVGMLNLTAKKLAILVPLSNDLLRFSRPNADAMVRNDVIRTARIREDLAFIRGLGTTFSPKGLQGWTPAANVLNVNATVNLANVTVDLGRLVLALMEANVALSQPGWIFAPRTWNYLMTLRDGNGNFAFREEMLQGRLWGYPFRTTTQIPTNLAVTDTNESEIYFADFADVIIGESSALTIDASTEAAYVDGGTLVSAFSRDQTVIRVIAHHDFGMRHDASVAYLADVDWQ